MVEESERESLKNVKVIYTLLFVACLMICLSLYRLCRCWYYWCWHHVGYADSVAPDQPRTLFCELDCPLIYRIGMY